MPTLRLQIPTIALAVFGLWWTHASAQSIELDQSLFPDLDQHSDEALRLRGLAQLYPGRILFEAPATPSAKTTGARPFALETLPGNVTYLRLYHLSEALETLDAHRQDDELIIDLRYMRSDAAAIDFGQLFDAKLTLHTVGTLPKKWQKPEQSLKENPTKRITPVVIICNRQTSGPIEAVLSRLQLDGHIIGIGNATAGKTGVYERFEGEPATWILEGELRAEPEVSLIPHGFQPRIRVDQDFESAYSSYFLYEAGTPLAQLIATAPKTERPETSPNEPITNASNPELSPEDPVLKKAIEVVAALQILTQLPK